MIATQLSPYQPIRFGLLLLIFSLAGRMLVAQNAAEQHTGASLPVDSMRSMFMEAKKRSWRRKI